MNGQFQILGRVRASTADPAPHAVALEDPHTELRVRTTTKDVTREFLHCGEAELSRLDDWFGRCDVTWIVIRERLFCKPMATDEHEQQEVLLRVDHE